MAGKNYLIGNAHLDPVWQWRVSEGLSLIRSTYRSALDRMKENENYKFTSACAGYYFWIQSVDPGMFGEIKQRVREGRWGIVGGMWVQPDCNLPAGESFCRHLLYSQRFFKEQFGVLADTGYNVDSFGHSAVLPQLFKKAGIDHYVYMRPNRETENPALPSENLHKWVSPDGSEVTAFRIPDQYGGDLGEERIAAYLAKEQDQMIFYGIGNHGGGPSKEHLRCAEEWVKKEGFVYATPGEYFRDVKNGPMPTVSGDLRHHAAGCYSANSKIKYDNRRAECALVTAEALDTLAALAVGGAYHNEAIQAAWQRVMFNQFHDVLAGCCIKEAFDDSYQAFGYARQIALELSNLAIQKIASRIKTTDFLDAGLPEMRDRLWYREGEGTPFVVFNPHSFAVNTTVELGTQFVSKVLDQDGNEVMFQLVRATYTDGPHKKKCLFEVQLPPMGYRVYYVYRKTENAATTAWKTDLTATETTLENDLVKIVLDPESGTVKSYFLKKENREFSQGDLGRAIVCDDAAHDTWSHGENTFNKEIRSFGEGTLSLVDNGPLCATVKSVTKSGKSVLKKYYMLYKNDAKLYLRCVLDADEAYTLIKLSFPVKTDSPKVVYSMPYGFLEKEADGVEEVAHEWADITDGKIGMGLLNDGKYSHCAIGNDLRVIAARSCAYLDHFAGEYRDDEMEFMDKGEQEFNLILFPHTEEATAELTNCGRLLNRPPVVLEESHHGGDLPQTYSALEISAKNIGLSAWKNSEDNDGLVMRLHETAGTPTDVTVTVKAIGRCFDLHFTPQEVKTVKILKDGTVKEIPIIE